ncbi:hypothetical protein EVAR_100257_1 [Eumeta japonica]|uniref:Uncharacterized protein n=1 Tax=Eumeta variegata TaxID=151549 RepID=A0A4C1SGZ5_EUMVA|nr:hypothetical protein EVAR_100257_1 [Eumeta japonica]
MAAVDKGGDPTNLYFSFALTPHIKKIKLRLLKNASNNLRIVDYPPITNISYMMNTTTDRRPRPPTTSRCRFRPLSAIVIGSKVSGDSEQHLAASERRPRRLSYETNAVDELIDAEFENGF